MNESSFADRLVAILERERRASHQAVRDVHSLSIEEQVESGEAVRGLSLLEGKGGEFLLQCPENVSRFRDGDLLWFGDGKHIGDGLTVVFRDYDPTEGTMRVEVDRFRPTGKVPSGTNLVLNRRELDLTDRTIQAVRSVFSGRDNLRACDLLLGRKVDVDSEPEVVAGEEMAQTEGLDDSQTKGFVDACGSRFSLVQGPPGCGKTRLASTVVKAFCEAGKTVLVTAFTHRAVNNVLDVVLRGSPEFRVLKIGSNTQSGYLRAGGATLVSSVRKLPRLEGPAVVGVTTHAAPGLRGRSFDLVLVDEAGQVGLPHGTAALALAPRHFIVGDHRQLSPLTRAEHQDPLAHCSLFEHLHEAYGSHMLKWTYRMNEALCRFPSENFYGGKLQAAAGNAEQQLELDGDPGPVLQPDPETVVVPMTHRGLRIVAPSEAEVAADLVVRAIGCGLPPDEVAVIAPHRAQGTRIRSLLRKKLDQLDPEQQPVVDTVERLQGGERDLIVLSLTASDPEALLNEAAFFFSPNRLNVALTRARRKLVILMSPAILEAFPDDPEALRGADLLRRIWRDFPHVEV